MKKINKILSVILAILMVISIIPITASAASDGICFSGHTQAVIPELAPTETTPGLTSGIACSICGTVILEQQVVPEYGATDADSVIDSGTCGANLTWTYNSETFALVISGTGAMNKYKSSVLAPWSGYRPNIKTIIITDGVTSIGNYAFIGCTNLIYASIPDTVTEIGSNAFSGCNKLKGK